MSGNTTWGWGGWLAAVAAASGLVLLAPNERTVMGQLPPLAAKAHDQRQLALPQELPAERTLAVLLFRQEQKAEAHSWIAGMRLHQDASIPWVKLRVQPAEAPAFVPGSARLISVSTDVGQLQQALVLSGTEHAQVVVLGRDGTVLAKAQGAYDEDKARALLETLRSD